MCQNSKSFFDGGDENDDGSDHRRADDIMDSAKKTSKQNAKGAAAKIGQGKTRRP